MDSLKANENENELIVVSDDQTDANRQTWLRRLTQMSRHYHCSVFIAVQHVSNIHPSIYTQCHACFLFGQIPDTLEDVWVNVALNDEQAARQLIDRTTATRNPFDVKYSRVEDADWETCASALNALSMKEILSQGW